MFSIYLLFLWQNHQPLSIMTKKTFWVAILMMTSVATFSCTQQDKGKEGKTPATIPAQADKDLAADEEKDNPDKPLAPDFTLKDLDGKDMTLSSLRGSYVVLDFWGSWCVWCIRGIPKMKEYYNKYAGKFEILGIDCHDTPDDWREAVKAHQLPWKHVYMPDDSSLLKTYSIQGFPTKIIISPDGTIVNTFIGESEEFYNTLDSLFQ